MNQEQFLQRLLAQDIDGLERDLSSAHQQFETDAIDETRYWQLVPDGAPSRVALLPEFTRWCQRYPQSYVAHAYAGAALIGVAWQARSEAWARQLTETRLKLMEQYFASAEQSLLQACELSSKPYLALAMGMALQSAMGECQAAPTWHERIEAAAMQSPWLAAERMWQLNPKWGGSIDLMTEFRNQARAKFNDAEFASVEVSYYQERADILSCEGQLPGALRMLDAADQAQRNSRTDASRADFLTDSQPKKAIALLESAIATEPTARKLCSLAYLYEETGEASNDGGAGLQASLNCYARAAQLGDGNAAANCVRILRKTGLNADRYAQAVQWSQLGIEQYSAKAHFHLGSIYFNGEHGARDLRLAINHWLQASALGHGMASQNVVLTFWDGRDGFAQDYKAALHAAELGAQVDDSFCKGALGRMLIQGQGTAKDVETGLDWLEEAASENDSEALEFLIRMLWFGQGIDKDREQAQQWLTRLESIDDAASARLRAELSSMFSTIKSWFGR
jgi:TPR repeat protein